MIQRRVITFAILLLVVFIIAPSVVLAASNSLPGAIVPKECNDPGGCQSICQLEILAQNVLNTGIYIAVFLSAILFAWAGWLYLTGVAGSDLSRAKSIFTNVAVGLVIILIGWLVVDTLMKTLTGSSSTFGPWNKICELLVHHASAFV